MNDALLSRQPILDRQQALVGYELSLGSSAGELVCAAYAELGVRSALGSNRAFLCVNTDFLHNDAIELLPADGVVIELSLDGAPSEATLTRCRSLRERGYSLALTDYRGLDERSRPLLSILDIIKIDIGHCDEPTLSSLAGALLRLPLKLLAQGVDTPAQMTRCLAIGFQLFQGNHFAKSEIISGRRLSATQAGLIRLINLSARDAETNVLEEAFKREPALTVNLLRIVNSVGIGGNRFGQKISSLRHAITLLGRRQLQRWLQLLLVSPANGSANLGNSPLLQVAALRGSMMEMLVKKAGDPALADLAFITGIMSMMPAALGMPMNEILDQITLEPEVREALSAQTGALGRLLALLECFDSDDTAGCDALLAELSSSAIDRAALNICLTDALRWVNGEGS
jgi:EAL and modified HD-GYP domain-containing signal transduction protein